MALNFDSHPILPESSAVAYKEWAGVCRALGTGRQTILLRKGGIAETGGVFHPEHGAFWLYPTHLHEAQQGLRDEDFQPEEDEPSALVRINFFAVVGSVTWVDRLDIVAELPPFHVWTEESILKRFGYRTPGIWVLGVRVYRRSEPFEVTIQPAHAGCRTWVPLDPPAATNRVTPVLSDEDYAIAHAALSCALAGPTGAS